MGKGEIARYEQFLLFPQCFQKGYCPGASKGVIVWEWAKQKDEKMYMMEGNLEQIEYQNIQDSNL